MANFLCSRLYQKHISAQLGNFFRLDLLDFPVRSDQKCCLDFLHQKRRRNVRNRQFNFFSINSTLSSDSQRKNSRSTIMCYQSMPFLGLCPTSIRNPKFSGISDRNFDQISILGWFLVEVISMILSVRRYRIKEKRVRLSFRPSHSDLELRSIDLAASGFQSFPTFI